MIKFGEVAQFPFGQKLTNTILKKKEQKKLSLCNL